MTPTSRLGSATLFAIVSIIAAGPAAATEQNLPTPDPQLCEAFLRDLKTWRAQAVAIGCEVPAENVGQTANADSQFPPVVTAEATPPAAEFPPVVAETSSSEDAADFPPVEQASAGPVTSGSSKGSKGSSKSSSKGSSGSSSSFPPVDTGSSDDADSFPPVDTASVETDEGIEEDQPIRAAIEEKLLIIKEEAKARIRDAIVLKGEEVKERVKQKIKDKIADAIQHHNHKDNDGAPTLRRAAKDAVKRMISSRHHQGGGGLLNKLAQLRRR